MKTHLVPTALLVALMPLSVLGQVPERPDVLFISIDDLNDWVGPLNGHPQVETPNMDRLAERGIVFTNAHAPAVVCNPSRTATMTGLLPSTSGVYLNTDWRTLPQFQDIRTIPRFFRDAGYSTFGAGKLFHAVTTTAPGYFGYNDTTAWDAFYPSLDRQLPDEITPHERPANGSPFDPSFDWSPVSADDRAMADGQVVAWSVEHLLNPDSGPRFNAIGIYRPHFPWYVPQAYFDRYSLEEIELPEVMENDLDDISDYAIQQGRRAIIPPVEAFAWLVESDLWGEMVRAYLASITFADAMLGQLLDALDDSGRADNTIIILWSDHGIQMGEKARVNKPALWHESTRVPLIIVAPGISTPGTRTAATVSLMDIYPTLTELAGLNTPQHIQGVSLVPLLENPNAEWDRAALSTQGYGNHAVTYGQYRYIRYSDGGEELYDLAADPNEWSNRSDDPALAEVKAGLFSRLPRSDAPVAHAAGTPGTALVLNQAD